MVWVSLASGFIGALIGAVGTILAQIVSAQRVDRREAKKVDADAFVGLLAATYALMDAAENLTQFSYTENLGLAEAHGRYLAEWQIFIRAYAEALYRAPRDAAWSIRFLREAIINLVQPVDHWISSLRGNPQAKLNQKQYQECAAVAARARRDYILATQIRSSDDATLREEDLPLTWPSQEKTG